MELNSLLSRALPPVLAACTSLAYADSLTVLGLGAGEDSVVALNAKTASGAGCLAGQDGDTWVARSPAPDGSIDLGNLKKGCVLYVAAFSRNHAVLVTRVTGWTSNGAEVRKVTVQPAIKVPITVWITHNDLDSVARAHMARAGELYAQNLVGITFDPVFNNVSADVDKVNLINAGIEGDDNDSQCTKIEALKGRAYTTRTLNVYYINREIVARNCATKRAPNQCNDFRNFPKANGNITYMGTQDKDNPATLSHELGHALGLRPGPCGGHVPDDGVDFGPDNIMVGAGRPTRDRFSLGQVFRMNTQKDRWGGTMLIMNHLRQGPGRHCRLLPPEATDSRCPALSLDRSGVTPP